MSQQELEYSANKSPWAAIRGATLGRAAPWA